MRYLGTQAMGIRMPIIQKGDNLAEIVVESVLKEGITLNENDIVGITESIVAKSQGNFASVDDIAEDIRAKFPNGVVGVVFPILSRNRFLNILKGIAKGADKVYVLLQFPSDEVGNPIMDINTLDYVEDKLVNKPIPSAKFKEIVNEFTHPFTKIDYISLYENVGDNVEVFLSNDPRDILKLTKDVLASEIHNRFVTKARLINAGANTVYTLSDILSSPVNGSGYNPDYGVLGSNISTNNSLKLFPKDCDEFVSNVRELFYKKTGVYIEILIYGDGAFKDPSCGIWELADPVVSPAYTKRLGGQPNEIKLKYVADTMFTEFSGEEKQQAITKMIKEKKEDTAFNEGTTPRKYADLLGSLCDLISGSGDKGTPVVLIKGYFDDYATE